MALGKEVTTETVRDLAGINFVVLLRGCDRAQHHWMRHLHLCSMRKQMIVDPAGEDRRFHRYRPGRWKSFHPAIQVRACCRNRALLLDPAAYVLYAVADRLLVNVEPDVLHICRGASVRVL